QSVYVVIGVLGLLIATLVDPDLYRTRWRVIFGGTSFLIAIVLLAGPIRGSKRWLDLGFFRFQPSEFGKVLFVLALAGFLAERAKRLGDRRTTLDAVGFAAIMIGLVFLQPDVGTAMVYAAALAAMLFVAGTKWSHLAALGAAWLRRCVDPARPLPARRVAGTAGRGHRARLVLRGGRGRPRLRAAVPDLHQRRDDDGNRPDHGHPAAVLQRRWVVDDREPL